MNSYLMANKHFDRWSRIACVFCIPGENNTRKYFGITFSHGNANGPLSRLVITSATCFLLSSTGSSQSTI
uniref:Uncharacterized protein n=1 Tax=Romanomermis culicivorax TaxID=13658 RepID=A0A915JZ41_ROMCU